MGLTASIEPFMIIITLSKNIIKIITILIENPTRLFKINIQIYFVELSFGFKPGELIQSPLLLFQLLRHLRMAFSLV